ncbi:MAG TPA: nucleotidyltransferase family protein [bacterium]|nr:nucleotidyltransferase family protein [bacterium]
MTDAIVLAGGGVEPGLPAGLATKALLEVGGRPLLAYVLAALWGAPSVGRIAVVGPAAALEAAADVVAVPDRGAIMDNVVAALEALRSADPVLVVAADIPLLTAQAVEEFLAACAKHSADFHYAIVPQEAIERAFPGARKTFVRVADGTFTGGSVMRVNPAVIDRVRPFVERIIASRKKPWLLAQVFGWAIVMKFASGRLTIAEMEAKVTELLGITARAVILPRPELALDVDMGKPENLEILGAALARR